MWYSLILLVSFTGRKDKNKDKKHKNKAGKKVKEKKEEKDDKEDKDEKSEHVQFEETPQILPPEPPVQVNWLNLFINLLKSLQLFYKNWYSKLFNLILNMKKS